jgi:hypothetical protein
MLPFLYSSIINHYILALKLYVKAKYALNNVIIVIINYILKDWYLQIPVSFPIYSI